MRNLLSILIYSLLCNLLAACGSPAEKYSSDVSMVFSTASSVKMHLPAPGARTLRYSSDEDLSKIKMWLLSATPPNSASLLDTTVPVTVEYKDGRIFQFRISDPRSPTKYSVIEWGDSKFVLSAFPFANIESLGRTLGY